VQESKIARVVPLRAHEEKPELIQAVEPI
jgi:hypothetical protein